MLLNGARGLSEPQASCPECRFAFKHFFSPLEVPGFWNGARNIPLHSQNTILQILRSIPDTLLKPFSELNSGSHHLMVQPLPAAEPNSVYNISDGPVGKHSDP